jgi:septum site-determining protein MinC
MTPSHHAVTFKSATLYAVRVVLHEHDTENLITSLNQRMQESGGFFALEPVVIDAVALSEAPDWLAVLAAFKQHALPVLGVSAQGSVLESAIAAGLLSIDMAASKSIESASSDKAHAAPQQSAEQTIPDSPYSAAETLSVTQSVTNSPLLDIQPTLTETAKATPSPQTMVVQGPLRSGQRIYARQCDLIVMGVVSQGAEVIADGNIHIYGPLRGKAMAGALGQTDARIFTTSLDAELVAIAGVYRVIEGVLPTNIHRKPSMIYLKEDMLSIEPLSA